MAMRMLAFNPRNLLLPAIASLVFSIAPMASGEALQGTVQFLIIPPTPQAESAPSTLSSICAGTVFCTRPNVFTSSLGFTGDNPITIPILVGCFDLATGQLIPNCTIRFSLMPEAFTGGHGHDDSSRPTGSVSCPNDFCNSGPSGVLGATYTSPEISGIVDITAQGTAPDGTVLPSATATIGVETAGLAAIATSGQGFQVDASRLHDLNNLYATPTVKAKLEALPGKFSNELIKQGLLSSGQAPPTLEYTGMSLPAGGLFDTEGTWLPPHRSHRFGLDADLFIQNPPTIAIPTKFRRALEKSIRESDFNFPAVGERPQDEGANHWHLRLK